MVLFLVIAGVGFPAGLHLAETAASRSALLRQAAAAGGQPSEWLDPPPAVS